MHFKKDDTICQIITVFPNFLDQEILNWHKSELKRPKRDLVRTLGFYPRYMKKIRPVHLISMIIGILGMVYSIYGLIKGKPFDEYLPTFFICLSLFGVAYLNHRKSDS